MKLSSTAHIVGYVRKCPVIIVLLSSLFLWSNSFAQTDAVNLSSANYKPGKKSDDCVKCLCICIQGSLDFANIHETPAPSGSYKTKVGFNIGAFAFYPVLDLGPGQLGLKGGLEFIEKGSKYSESGYTSTIALNYIELPIDVIYQYPVMDNGSVFAGLGPYFADGIGGKTNDGSSTTNSFGGSDGFKRFDAGLHLTAGYRMSCLLSASLVYEIGIVNIANNSNGLSGPGYPTLGDHNHVFSINLAYCLGGLMH
jgi:Outer membrane protein beta-barrel domain